MIKCASCGRFYSPQKNDKMCKECKLAHEVTFQRLTNNPALKEVLKRLADK